MPDTHYATCLERSAVLPTAYAMICPRLGLRAKYCIVFREAMRSTPMMAAARFTHPFRAILLLVLTFAMPSLTTAATLEESAKELAQKIAAALPAQENVSCEIRNLSPLQPAEVARIEQALRSELQNHGVRFSANGGAAIAVVVTLSKNFKDLVWTGEIRQGDTMHAVLTMPAHSSATGSFSDNIFVTIHRDKFWEGPDHILDVLEIAGIGGEPWFVLLLRDKLLIQEPSGRLEISFPPAAIRDPVGKLGQGENGYTIAFTLASLRCSADLGMRRLIACLPMEGNEAAPLSSIPLLIDPVPVGPTPPGKGIGLAIGPICRGDTNLALVTRGRDYTQTDSLQVFQMESGGPVAVSSELEFPGPILDLHSSPVGPRAVVRNLTTGNYEAYRLSVSCGQ
jgi:hypothetical protein